MKAELFRVLGHPARVRILELLKDGELSVGQLQSSLELDSSGTSQHLASLRRVGLVDTRRAGTSVYYRLRDRRTVRLLDVARQILLTNLKDAQALLEGLADGTPPPPRTPRGSGSRGRQKRAAA